MSSYSSYQTFKKPYWAPPAWVFGPVWTVLYIIIAISFGAVFYATATGAAPVAVALPFALNLVFNFAYTYLQFGLKKYVLASADVILVLGTLLWALTLRSSQRSRARVGDIRQHPLPPLGHLRDRPPTYGDVFE